MVEDLFDEFEIAQMGQNRSAGLDPQQLRQVEPVRYTSKHFDPSQTLRLKELRSCILEGCKKLAGG